MKRNKEVDEQTVDKKQKKPKQVRATLALVLAIITLVGSLFGSVLISQEVSASEVRDVVTTEVEYRIQEVMASPPMQEIMETESIDTDALTQEITDLVTADVLSKAMRQWQTLSTQDLENLESQIADIIANSLHNSVSNLNSEEIVNRINENLNISTNESFLQEEWLVQLITDTVTALVEQTLVDVLSQEMEIIGQDLQLIQTYVDENLDTIYQLITDSQIDIVNMSNDITNLQEQINNAATKEELLQLSTQLEMAITDLTVAQSDMQVQMAFLEQTMSDRYDELLAMVEHNAADIAALQAKLNQTIAETTAQINNLSNQISEQLSASNEEINNTLNTEITNVTNRITESTELLNETIVGNYDDLLARLEALEAQSQQTIQGVKDDINSKVDDNREKTETNITYVDNKVTEQIDSTDNRLTNQLNETATNIYNSMNDLDEQINITVDSLAYNIYSDMNSLDQDIIDAFAAFNSNSFKNFSTLHAYTKSVEDCLNYNVQNIEQITNSNTQKTETWIEELDARQQRNLTTVANQLNTNINTMSTYIKSEVDTAIKTLNSNITNEIGAKFSAFATSTATAVNQLGSSTENVFKSMGEVVKVQSFNKSTGVLYLTSTTYPFDGSTKITKPSLTAPTINMATVTLGQMGALPTIEVRDGQVYVNGSKATNNIVNDPVLEQIQYQDTVQDPTVDSFIDSGKNASNPQYDDSVTNPEDRDYTHTDYEDGTYSTITWDEQGNIDGEVETFGTQ